MSSDNVLFGIILQFTAKTSETLKPVWNASRLPIGKWAGTIGCLTGKFSYLFSSVNLYTLFYMLSLVILWWTCLLVCTGLEEQLDQAKKHVEQFRSMSEANESALGDLNKVIKLVWNTELLFLSLKTSDFRLQTEFSLPSAVSVLCKHLIVEIHCNLEPQLTW